MSFSSAQHAFDDRAETYEANAHVQREAAAWLAEWLPERIEGPSLELGAGTGIFTCHLAARASDLLATDISPGMARVGAGAVPHARWEVSDASAPPCRGDYAWIFSCSLAQWLHDPGAAFRRWREVSAPGARLLAGWFVRGTMEKFLAACPGASACDWRDQREWLGLLSGAGWRTLRSETKAFVLRHAGAAAMLREMHDLGAVRPRRFGAGQLRAALRAFDGEHARGGRLETPFVFLRVEARRE